MKNIIIKMDEQKFTTREYALLGAILFVAGILVGMLLSPKGMRTIGSNNGSNNIVRDNAGNGVDFESEDEEE